MTSRKQIALEPSLTHMLRKIGIHDTSVNRQILISLVILGIPVTLGLLKYLVQTVTHGLVGSKDTEVLRFLIKLEDITHKAAKLYHILLLNSTRFGNIYRIIPEIRKP